MSKKRSPHSTARMAAMRGMVDRLDPLIEGRDDDPAFRTAVVLLAAACLGPDVDGLVARTGYERELITKIADRMRLAGLWSNTSVSYQHWLADDGDTIEPCSFWADVLVAEGLVAARPGGPASVRYWAIEPVQ